jgi:peptidoglycan/xylan/chitin deacetylase (PgdA/CDA1 family)
MRTIQKSGKIALPLGKKVAVALSCMFDGQSIWLGDQGKVSQFAVSAGEVDAVACLPRIINALDKYGVKATFFIPGHTADTFPDECRMILDKGHELAHHGYNKSMLTDMSYEEEELSIQMGIAALERIGAKPVGFRAPCGEISENTLGLLEKYGFLYDTSLMGNDLYPYYPRPIEVHADKACVYGEPYSVLELPSSLHLDDFPYKDTAGHDLVLPYFDCAPVAELRERCEDTYYYACRYEGAMLNLTIHTASSGKRSRIVSFEQLLEFFVQQNAWIAPCRQIAEAVIPESFV